jgi:hypothetical protein
VRNASADGRLERHGGVHQRVERVEAEDVQHLPDLGVVRADVPFLEAVGGLDAAPGRGPLRRRRGANRHYFASLPT